MDHSKRTTKTSRRRFAKSAVSALSAISMASLAGRTVGQKRRQRPGIDQTSPITIGGGGSVSIDFKHTDYLGASGKYSKANDEIEAIWVYTAQPSQKWDLTQFVFRKDCSITVHTKKGSSSREIIVRSKPGTGRALSIEFDDVEFKPDHTNANHHYHKDHEIVGLIEIVDNLDQSRIAFSLPPKGFFQVVNYERP